MVKTNWRFLSYISVWNIEEEKKIVCINLNKAGKYFYVIGEKKFHKA